MKIEKNDILLNGLLSPFKTIEVEDEDYPYPVLIKLIQKRNSIQKIITIDGLYDLDRIVNKNNIILKIDNQIHVGAYIDSSFQLMWTNVGISNLHRVHQIHGYKEEQIKYNGGTLSNTVIVQKISNKTSSLINRKFIRLIEYFKPLI